MAIIHGFSLHNLRGDIYGGLTAAVVALPLALAFGVASGAGPVAGLYGAIFVGLFAALFGGTPAQVSGPTGPMTVVMAGVITQYGNEPALAFTVVMMAGVFQIIFGATKLGNYIRLMPYPVISGFMSGIGVIIIILQIGPLLGHGSGGAPLAALAAIPAIISEPVWDAVLAGVLSLVIVVFMPRRLSKIIPAPLVALVVGTVAVMLVLGQAPVLGDIPKGLPILVVPRIDIDVAAAMIQSALVLAVLGSIDSLLTSLIADNVTNTYHDSNRELIGQGIGNTLAGLFGAIPGAGATMRTVVNARAGGRTPISGALHALVLLAIVLGLGSLAERIPHAVLAGILIKVGIDIIDWQYLRRVHSAPRSGVFFMVTVLLLTVFVDLITAVAVGVVMASLLFVKRMSDLQLASITTVTDPTEGSMLDAEENAALEAVNGDVVLEHLRGPFSFGAAKDMARLLGAADYYKALIIDLSDVTMLDSSASLAVEDVIRGVQARDKQVLVAGARPQVRRVLDKLGVSALIPPTQMCGTRLEALQQAARLLEKSSEGE